MMDHIQTNREINITYSDLPGKFHARPKKLRWQAGYALSVGG
jgi:hypothetical protein